MLSFTKFLLAFLLINEAAAARGLRGHRSAALAADFDDEHFHMMNRNLKKGSDSGESMPSGKSTSGKSGGSGKTKKDSGDGSGKSKSEKSGKSGKSEKSEKSGKSGKK